jgi:hypothetical protein
MMHIFLHGCIHTGRIANLDVNVGGHELLYSIFDVRVQDFDANGSGYEHFRHRYRSLRMPSPLGPNGISMMGESGFGGFGKKWCFAMSAIPRVVMRPLQMA